MNICLIGNNLTSLVLAKILINYKIKVNLYYKNTKKNKFNTRTIGISKNNLDFLNKEILKIPKKFHWKIKKISVFSEKFESDSILNFQNSDTELFSIVRYSEIINIYEKNLKNNKLFKKILIKNDLFYDKLIKNQKYDLVINCDASNKISKKFFYSKVKKNYDSFAYTTIINHKNVTNDNAVQIFTKLGPIAYLPISNNQTSIVYSISNLQKKLDDNQIIDLIRKYNKNYDIVNFSKIEKFPLNLSILRNYYHKNILSFGDNLHKIHPLAGQGFNMTIRDTKILSDLIKDRLELGLPLDFSIYQDFEKKTKHINYIFSSGIDFIHNFFQLDNKYQNNYSNNMIKKIGKNKFFNEVILKYADRGIDI